MTTMAHAAFKKININETSGAENKPFKHRHATT
jgi:hypothetical protein